MTKCRNLQDNFRAHICKILLVFYFLQKILPSFIFLVKHTWHWTNKKFESVGRCLHEWEKISWKDVRQRQHEGRGKESFISQGTRSELLLLVGSPWQILVRVHTKYKIFWRNYRTVWFFFTNLHYKPYQNSVLPKFNNQIGYQCFGKNWQENRLES